MEINSIKKRVWSSFILAILFFVKPSYSDSRLKMHKIDMDEKETGFYKAITDMVITNDKLIIADFLSNQVLCYKYQGATAVFSNFIGRPGQGPGDIQKPIALSAFKDRVAIRDQENVSIFSTDGEFFYKFKQFSPIIDHLMNDNRIYYLSSNLSSKFLMSVLSLNGELLSQILEKRLWVNSGELTALNSFREKLVYDGHIWSDGKYLFYISRYFGTIEKISLSGELLLKRDISEDLGNNARTKSAVNRKTLIQSRELKLDKGSPDCYELFLDSYLDGEYLYLLMSQYDLLNKKPIKKVDIRRINTSDLKLSSSYSVELKSKEWLSNLCVRTVNHEPIFLVDVQSETGLELYEFIIDK